MARLEQLLLFLASDPQAPTSVKDPQRGVDVHVADSLSGLQVDALREHPGSSTSAAAPASRASCWHWQCRRRSFDLVEATVAKVRISGARGRRAWGSRTPRVVCTRAEEWGPARDPAPTTAAVVRAVGLLPTLLEYAAPLLETGGGDGRLEGKARPRRGAPGTVRRPAGSAWERGRWNGWAHTPGSRNRHIHTYEKVAPTPPGFPGDPAWPRSVPSADD